MLKSFGIFFAVMLFGASAFAQPVSTTTTTGAAAQANSGVINVIGGGGGTNGGGTANINTTGTLWTLGGTPSMSAVSYDACTQYFSMSAVIAGINIPLDKETCWGMRQGREMATSAPPGSLQYAHNCLTSRDWTTTDWETGTMACPRNKDKLRKQNANDPRIAVVNYPAVVFAGTVVQGVATPQDPRALSIKPSAQAPTPGLNQKAPPGGAVRDAPTYSSEAPQAQPVQQAALASFNDRRFP